MKRIDWPVVSALGLLAIGCAISREPAPRCTTGATVACACPRGEVGVQSCLADGTLDSCDCSMSSRCEPGALFACACTGGTTGSQTCNTSGMFDPCVCDGPHGTGCIPGAAAACACTSGATGAQICSVTGVFGACSCEPGAERCVPGATNACTCSDGFTSVQTCGDDGRYAACDCAYLDAEIPDGGADAAPHICDPFVGETCGCPEVLPPAAPTLTPASVGRIASGTESLVDAFVTEGGIAVVLTTGVRLLSRTGTELARWNAPRELRAAAFDGTRLVVVDPSTATSLGLDLAEQAHVTLTADCSAAALISCGRLVCTGSTTGSSAEVGLYDMVGATQLSATTYWASGLPVLRRVPGVDAVIGGDHDDYLVVDEANRVIVTGSVYSLDLRTIGFQGSPARHMITADGHLYRLDACTVADWTSTSCFERDGSIGTLRTGESVLAMERGGDNRLYALVTPTAPSYPYTVCTTGCAVQRIDVDAHVIESAGSVTFSLPQGVVRLRHDAWGGRVVLAMPGSCTASYPNTCSGWAVTIAAYD